MKFREIGNSGIRISEIGFGAWAIGGPVDLFGIPVGYGAVNDLQSVAALEKAWDEGINFFDTADVYGGGHSEELIGSCSKIKDCVLATKVGNARTATEGIKDFSRGHILKSIEGSLRRLKRETVDLYQLHNPPPEVLYGDEVFETLDLLKQQGKIRLRGVSISAMDDGVHLIENKKVDCLQVLFNILNQEPAKKVIPLAEENGVGIIVRVPLASGLLTGKFSPNVQFASDDNRRNFLTAKRMREVAGKIDHLKEIVKDTGYSLAQIALAFLLKHSGVSAPIPGAKTPEQAQQNASASGMELSDALFNTIKKDFSSYNFYLRNNVRI